MQNANPSVTRSFRLIDELRQTLEDYESLITEKNLTIQKLTNEATEHLRRISFLEKRVDDLREHKNYIDKSLQTEIFIDENLQSLQASVPVTIASKDTGFQHSYLQDPEKDVLDQLYQKYGKSESEKSARLIQLAYRQYKLRQNFLSMQKVFKNVQTQYSIALLAIFI